MRQSQLILSNTFILWLCNVLSIFPPLILVPFLIQTLGESGYGAYTLIWSLFMAIEQFQKSLQSGVVKYCSAYLAKKDISGVNRILSTSFVYSIFLALIAFISFLFISLVYNDPSAQIKHSLLIISLFMLLLVPITPYVAIVQARQRFFIESSIALLFKYLSLGFIYVWFIFVSPSLIALIIVMATSLLISRLINIPISHKLVAGLKTNLRLFDKGDFRLIAAFGSATILASICLALNSTGLRWLMDFLESKSFVAHLAIIMTPTILLSQIVSAMTVTIMPATSAYASTGNTRMLGELLIRSMRYVAILISAACLASGLLLKSAFLLWLGPDYTFLAPYALAVFISMGFMLSTSTIHHMLKGLAKLKTVIFIYFVALVVMTFCATLILYVIGKSSYLSVTIGLSAGYISCALLHILKGAKAVSVSQSDLLRRVYYRAPSAAVILYFLGKVLSSALAFNHIWQSVLITLGALLIFAFVCFRFIATKTEKDQFSELLLLFRKRISPISL